MSVPKDRPQTRPGAPLTAEREQYRRLMAQGLNNHQACLQIGVHPTTGMRWRKGRTMVDHTGKARYYPPVHAEPAVSSPRYLSEETRILIGDPLAAGRTPRSVAAELRRSPSTISREIRRNTSGAGSYRPFGAHRKALARRTPASIGQTSPRQRVAGLRAIQARAAVEPAADLPRTTDRIPLPTPKALVHETIYQESPSAVTALPSRGAFSRRYSSTIAEDRWPVCRMMALASAPPRTAWVTNPARPECPLRCSACRPAAAVARRFTTAPTTCPLIGSAPGSPVLCTARNNGRSFGRPSPSISSLTVRQRWPVEAPSSGRWRSVLSIPTRPSASAASAPAATADRCRAGRCPGWCRRAAP